jgi:glycosyltransferase involved in cell wall biosynthesis
MARMKTDAEGKKNLLFIIPGLSAGGGERSLINLLTGLDYSRYNVDLQLLSHEGLFMNLIPRQVRLLPLREPFATFSRPLGASALALAKKGSVRLAADRVLYSLHNRIGREGGKREQRSWRHLSRSFSRLSKTYDAAIGFLEKTSIYFCVEKVNAAVKIGWVHNDYDKLELAPAFDRRYFAELDHLVTVSRECANVLKMRFPEHSGKIAVIHNVVSPGLIREMAFLERGELYNRANGEFVIVSIGRLHEQKNFELAIEACRKLLDRGLNVQWHVIGEGPERAKLNQLIASHGLEGRFWLLGLKANPYPYVHQADLYVQTSLYEGKAIAVDEAKILQKPIVITNFSTARDQLRHESEGLIAEMNADAVADAIARLAADASLRQRITSKLAGQQLGTEKEIDKLYSLVEGGEAG